MRLQNLASHAFRESLKGQHASHRVGAMLVKGGSILGKESNLSRPYGVENRGAHAEERLLSKLKGQEAVRGATMVIVRSNKHGKLCSMSRPCGRCWSLVQAAGVRKVVYYNWQSQLTVERVK